MALQIMLLYPSVLAIWMILVMLMVYSFCLFLYRDPPSAAEGEHTGVSLSIGSCCFLCMWCYLLAMYLFHKYVVSEKWKFEKWMHLVGGAMPSELSREERTALEKRRHDSGRSSPTPSAVSTAAPNVAPQEDIEIDTGKDTDVRSKSAGVAAEHLISRHDAVQTVDDLLRL